MPEPKELNSSEIAFFVKKWPKRYQEKEATIVPILFNNHERDEVVNKLKTAGVVSFSTNNCDISFFDRFHEHIWPVCVRLQGELFSARDEFVFKRQFISTFLATKAAIDFDHNCTHGWDNAGKPAVEDAAHLATVAWNEWVDKIGITPLNRE